MNRINQLMVLFKKSKVQTSINHCKFVTTICLVPAGRVATYGQIAKLAGLPGSARQVVWTLHSSSRKYKMPWHRIINSKGKIALPDDHAALKQRTLLQNEGVEIDSFGKIDLKLFLWKPDKTKLKVALKRVAKINGERSKKRAKSKP